MVSLIASWRRFGGGGGGGGVGRTECSPFWPAQAIVASYTRLGLKQFGQIRPSMCCHPHRRYSCL